MFHHEAVIPKANMPALAHADESDWIRKGHGLCHVIIFLHCSNSFQVVNVCVSRLSLNPPHWFFKSRALVSFSSTAIYNTIDRAQFWPRELCAWIINNILRGAIARILGFSRPRSEAMNPLARDADSLTDGETEPPTTGAAAVKKKRWSRRAWVHESFLPGGQCRYCKASVSSNATLKKKHLLSIKSCK